MQRTALRHHPCSIARALDAVGEWWTPLILRDVFYGLRRFGEIQEDLGISANVLSDRLATLVSDGLLATRVYQQRPERREYVLTEKGHELAPVLIALMQWGDRWGWREQQQPVKVVHEQCGGEVTVELRCPGCARTVAPEELLAAPGRPVSDPPAEHEPGYRSGRILYSTPGGVPLGR